MSKESGISIQLLYYRIQHGWPMEKVMTTPQQETMIHRCLYNGKEIGVREVSRIFGLTREAIYKRLNRGDTLQDVVDRPYRPKGITRRRIIEYKGKSTTFVELSKKTGLSITTLRQRYDQGKRNNALTELETGVAHTYRTINYRGRMYNMCELSRLPECKVKLCTLRARINVSGWPVEKAVETPLIVGWKGGRKEDIKT